MHPRIAELIDHITVHRRDVHDAIASVPSELRDRRPATGQWSVAEVIEHLSIIERRVAALLAKHVTAARANGVGPDPETSSVVASYSDPNLVLDRTTKVPAPPPVQPTGSLDSAAGTLALVESRAVMISSLQNANGVCLEGLMQTHPVFGPLNMYHWIVALGLHDRRHAAQIREIGQSLTAG
jgi:hypothetical protein